MEKLSWPALIRTLIRGESLTAAETAWAMNEIMSGAASSSQIAGFGVALRAKGETPEEMSGLASAMLEHATPITVPGRIADLVGTGGDGLHTVNVSTMATIVAASAGARMAKHGNRAASSSCGAADVLEALGVVIDLPVPATVELAEAVGVVFLFAPLYHPAFRHTAVPRRELGVPTAFNFLGPLTNPARPAALAVGVADPRMGPVLAGVLAARGVSALVFHGADGLDELTTTTTSSVWVVSPPSTPSPSGPPDVSSPSGAPAGAPGPRNNESAVSAVTFDPAELGMGRASVADLRGGDAARNAAIIRAVLGGERGPVRDIVLLNAAAALAAEAGVPDAGSLTSALAAGLARATEAIDSGAATALLDRWATTSHRLAAR